MSSGGQDQKLMKVSDQKLRWQLKLASRKIQHVTELLRESEASSLRLGDQAKLLKEEIRRCVQWVGEGMHMGGLGD